MTEIYKNLETKLSDKTWTDKFEADDLKLITDVKDVTENLISQVFIFIDFFHQYVDAVQGAAIFSPEYAEKVQGDAEVYPTQTSAPAGPIPANRAERRGVKKVKPIIPQGADNA